ncbi:hypothetical protein PV08_07137 [Exophiala spinifera]|uniref:Uncharacterized protein n=1 Tax=Exophiala spinifera TaxID=91928 RepID=A0A0D2B6P5_9EURO|nr:uncharacterized protein PV08_07137 [Exophiala spinifera]KIW14355.1 hypothetical protein PV08_07137 [Exophiala spinifera]
MSDINELPNLLMPVSARRKRSASPHPGTVGRPMKRTAELRPTPRERAHRVQLVHGHAELHMVAERRRAGLSALESMPPEIIQDIFFKCMEVNMPRASRYLGAVLAHERIFRSTILMAYFDDDLESPIVYEHFKPAVYFPLSLEHKIRLQRQILACKWFSLKLLWKSLPELVHLNVVQARARELRDQKALGLSDDAIAHPYYQNTRQSLLGTVPAEDDEEALMAHYRAPVNFLHMPEEGCSHCEQHHHHYHYPVQEEKDEEEEEEEEEGEEGPELEVQPEPNDADSESASDISDDDALEQAWPPNPRICVWRCWADQQGRLHKEMERGISVLAVRALPDCVIDVPRWTAERIDLLKFLRQGMRYLHHDQVLEISAEALFRGLRTALRQRNEDATLVLLELHYATMRAHLAPPQIPEREPISEEPRFDNLVGPFVHPLPQALILDAVPAENSRREFNPMTLRLLSYMLCEGVDSLEPRNPRLSRWAINASSRLDNPNKVKMMGLWVMGQMFRTARYMLRDGEPLFVNGKPTYDEDHATPWPWEGMTFTQKLRYDTDGEVPMLPTAPDGRPCGGTRVPLEWDHDPNEDFIQDDSKDDVDIFPISRYRAC